MKKHYDIIIVGGGVVGCTVACALAQQTSLSIALLEAFTSEPSWSSSQYHHRVSAIALSSQRIFQAIKVWDDIKKSRVSPFTQIHVWDAMGSGEVFFDSKEIAEPMLGYILENNLMQSVLLQKLKNYPQVDLISPIQLTAIHENEHEITLEDERNQFFSAKLVVGADGANSWLRKKAGIEINQHDYDQEAIVATVRTASSHQKIARQVFLEGGPLAFLPLEDLHTSSIVWSLPLAEAAQVMSLDNEKFKDVLGFAFAHRLGEVLNVEERYTFPLKKQQAKSYIKPRIALVGDASHTIHPLAGQGVNMGLLDAACLIDVIKEALKKRRDFSELRTLRQYERWRKADNAMMFTGVDLIKNLFASDKKSIQQLRALGLTMTNRIPIVKRWFARYAVGNREDLPTLASVSH